MEPLTSNVTPAKAQPALIFPECDPREEDGGRLEVELMCSHLLLSAPETPTAPEIKQAFTHRSNIGGD